MLTPDEKELFKTGVEVALAPYKELTLRAFGPLAKQIGDILGDYGRFTRFKNLARILGKMQKIADECGIEINIIPPRILLPAVHFASLEDDEDFQEKWAALLTNTAVEPDGISPSFPDILHSLTPVEARFLDRVYDELLEDAEEKKREQERFKYGPPSKYANALGETPVRPESLEDASEVMLDNIARLGLFKRYPMSEEVFGHPQATFGISAFGCAFIRACRAPGGRQGKES